MISIVIIILLLFSLLGSILYFVKKLEKESLARKDLEALIREKDKAQKKSDRIDAETAANVKLLDDWVQPED